MEELAYITGAVDLKFVGNTHSMEILGQELILCLQAEVLLPRGNPSSASSCFSADGLRLLRMIHFLVLSRIFIFADIALLLLMLATLSIRALSIHCSCFKFPI